VGEFYEHAAGGQIIYTWDDRRRGRPAGGCAAGVGGGRPSRRRVVRDGRSPANWTPGRPTTASSSPTRTWRPSPAPRP